MGDNTQQKPQETTIQENEEVEVKPHQEEDKLHTKTELSLGEPKQKESTPDDEKKKLESLKKRAQEEMIRLKTVFPFDLFPNEIIIDEQKITIHNKTFFWSGFIETIPLDDLTNVLVSTSPFTATLELHLGENIKKIQNLEKERAIEAKEILTGFLTAKKEKIDLEKLDPSVVAEHLKETGAIHGSL